MTPAHNLDSSSKHLDIVNILQPAKQRSTTASKFFSSTHAGVGGPLAFATPKRGSFKLAFSAKASLRSSSPGRDGLMEEAGTAALVDNAQLDRINDNLSKLCESLCG